MAGGVSQVTLPESIQEASSGTPSINLSVEYEAAQTFTSEASIVIQSSWASFDS
jgi:hypothetical protein